MKVGVAFTWDPLFSLDECTDATKFTNHGILCGRRLGIPRIWIRMDVVHICNMLVVCTTARVGVDKTSWIKILSQLGNSFDIVRLCLEDSPAVTLIESLPLHNTWMV